MVSAEMLNCKLLSTQAAGMKDLYFTSPMTRHCRTLARTLCYGADLVGS
jgi:hypothetical protein